MARPQRRKMTFGLVLAIVTALSGLGLLVLSGWFIAASAVAGATAASAPAFSFAGPLAGIRGFAVLRIGARYTERLVTHDATFRFLAGLRVWLFRAAIPLAPARLEEQRGGDLLNRMTADVDSLDAIYLRVIVPSVVAVVAVLLIGGVLLWLDPPAAVIVVALALLVGIVLPLVMRRISAPAGQAIAAATARLRTRIVEGVQGLAELKVYQADGRHAEAVLAENETLMAAQRHMARLSGVSAELAHAIATSTCDQVRGAEEVAGAMQSIAAVAVQTEQAGLQARRTVDDLVKVADELTRTLARFRLATA